MDQTRSITFVMSCLSVEELATEFYRDIEVASLVDPDRIKRKSTTSLEDSSSSISRDSK